MIRSFRERERQIILEPSCHEVTKCNNPFLESNSTLRWGWVSGSLDLGWLDHELRPEMNEIFTAWLIQERRSEKERAKLKKLEQFRHFRPPSKFWSTWYGMPNCSEEAPHQIIVSTMDNSKIRPQECENGRCPKLAPVFMKAFPGWEQRGGKFWFSFSLAKVDGISFFLSPPIYLPPCFPLPERAEA